jgi:hypothetical protein
MDSESTTFLARARLWAGSAAESAFENPGLLGVYILGGLTIFWIIEGNTYGIATSLVSMAVSLMVARRFARR